jgi:hypothetical protein
MPTHEWLILDELIGADLASTWIAKLAGRVEDQLPRKTI